jgi:hypothetical protein
VSRIVLWFGVLSYQVILPLLQWKHYLWQWETYYYERTIDCSITFHYCEWETSYYAQNNSTCRQLRSLVTCKLGTRTIYPSFQIFCRQASLVPQQNCFWWITSDQGCSGIPTCNGLIFSPKDSLGSNFERFGHNCVDGETNHFVFLPFFVVLDWHLITCLSLFSIAWSLR